MNKKKKIVIQDYRKKINDSNFRFFKVKKVVNSIQYHIGQYLKKDEVGSLCKNPNWTVELTN